MGDRAFEGTIGYSCRKSRPALLVPVCCDLFERVVDLSFDGSAAYSCL